MNFFIFRLLYSKFNEVTKQFIKNHCSTEHQEGLFFI